MRLLKTFVFVTFFSIFQICRPQRTCEIELPGLARYIPPQHEIKLLNPELPKLQQLTIPVTIQVIQDGASEGITNAVQDIVEHPTETVMAVLAGGAIAT